MRTFDFAVIEEGQKEVRKLLEDNKISLLSLYPLITEYVGAQRFLNRLPTTFKRYEQNILFFNDIKERINAIINK